MRIIKNIIVAFSLYSRIPMPIFEWKEEDMKHNLVFLSFIGGVIGLVSYGLFMLFRLTAVPFMARVLLYALVPLIITGGFHMDGYMDVEDALKSYKSPEEKLEILKDPHIGAFAVIRLVIYGMIYLAFLSIIVSFENTEYLYLYFVIFFLSRALCAAYSLKLKHAKKSGMLHMETEKTTKVDVGFCIIEAVVALEICAYINIWGALVMALVCLAHFFFYKKRAYKEFGGVSGDTTGYSIVTLEEALVVAIALLSIVMNLF